MKCLFCGSMDSKVIDSRQSEDGLRIRRRRECLACSGRFTTYEVLEAVPATVKKRDGSIELFDGDKLLRSLLRAFGKRPVSMDQLQSLVSDIQNQVENRVEREISSAQLGELVMERLKELDQVAYVRFASVYKEFTDIDSFLEELNALKTKE